MRQAGKGRDYRDCEYDAGGAESAGRRKSGKCFSGECSEINNIEKKDKGVYYGKSVQF